MPYDASLDEGLYKQEWETDTDRLTVSVYSYNQGQKKIQVNRENKNAQGEFRFAKLGRLTGKRPRPLSP